MSEASDMVLDPVSEGEEEEDEELEQEKIAHQVEEQNSNPRHFPEES